VKRLALWAALALLLLEILLDEVLNG